MRRRTFLKITGAGLAGSASYTTSASGSTSPLGKIMTVRGPIDHTEAGIMLPHEHIMSRFGAEISDDPVYDNRILNGRVRPYLEYLKGLGCGTVADCTTRYFGRDAGILRDMSEKSGLHLIANTGYYGAADDRYVPEHAYEEPPEKLARRWIEEFKNGIKGTGIRPGFIKIGIDPGPLSEIDAKLVRGAAITHLETGMVMAIHTGDNLEAVKQQFEILREEGVDPSAWIWVHAQNVKNIDALAWAADQGAWIEFDGVSEKNAESHLQLVNQMKKRGLLDRVLLSHDGNSYNAVGEKSVPKNYDFLFTIFIPALETEGYPPEEIRTLVRENPQKAFKIKIRKI